MLSPARYLLGVADVVALAAFAWLGASSLRSRLLPDFSGPPAHLATTVLALALLIWTAELLGSFSLFQSVPYLLAVAIVGTGIAVAVRRAPTRSLSPPPGPAGPVALAIAVLALVHFAAGVRLRLSTGMTGFDSTWYHGPFAAGFFQSGNTWDLHYIAPQFLAWFYPANAEIFHATGMLAFHRDLLSPLLNLGWFAGCLFSLWCIGRPFGVAPWSLALGAIALSVPALADQAGEARNDIVGIFFLLAAVAIALNAPASHRRVPEGEGTGAGDRHPIGRPDGGLSRGALFVAALAAGLAAGTKLNFLLPAAVLVVGLGLSGPVGGRRRALAVSGVAALLGGGYWYLRNLAHSGNPLPWFDHLGPIPLPAPQQVLGGREGHTVLSYLTDGSVWSDWFLPGLHGGLTVLWPLFLGLALIGLLLSLRAGSPLRVMGLVGLAAAFSWLIAPTSASGPLGMPRGFESGLRYLAPALVLGLAMLPVTPSLRARLRRLGFGTALRAVPRNRIGVAAVALSLVAAIAIGYPVQLHYLENRYARPEFASKGLDAAFEWASSISGARIATTGTRQYPLFGTDLSNHVQFVGIHRPHGGFVAPSTCPTWRRALNAGHYDYVVATLDRLEPGKPAYPPQAAWTAGPGTHVVLQHPGTVVFQLTAPLDPSACP